MKHRKTRLISLSVIGLVIVGCATFESAEADKSNQTNWQKKTPQLFSNAGYLSLEESTPKVQNLSESMEELRGPITNPFGIRDDILEYINDNIPRNNESAVRAAIKLAQYRQRIYFDNPTESEAMILQSKQSLAFLCLSGYLNTSPKKDDITSVQRAGKVMKIMFDTKDRDSHRWEIDRKYFSWKVLGTHLSIADENIACQRGEF